jgi:anti-anti-sigma factor
VSLMVRTEGATAILTPRGMLLSGQDTEELEQKIVELDASGNRRLLINLSETTYMSSAGLGVLLLARAKYLKRGATVKLCGVSGAIGQLFDLVKMPMVYEGDLHETEEAALAAIRLTASAEP